MVGNIHLISFPVFVQVAVKRYAQCLNVANFNCMQINFCKQLLTKCVFLQTTDCKICKLVLFEKLDVYIKAPKTFIGEYK